MSDDNNKNGGQPSDSAVPGIGEALVIAAKDPYVKDVFAFRCRQGPSCRYLLHSQGRVHRRQGSRVGE